LKFEWREIRKEGKGQHLTKGHDVCRLVHSRYSNIQHPQAKKAERQKRKDTAAHKLK